MWLRSDREQFENVLICVVGFLSDVVTKKNYIQDLPSSSGMTYSNVIVVDNNLNLNVPYDL